MGEYATRKIDNFEVKIGTCENIFNCRYEQRGEIVYPYMCDNLFWRIPTPDEDGIRPGDFNLSLLKNGEFIPQKLRLKSYRFSKDEVDDMKQVGTIQLGEERMGLLVNIRCPHGFPIEQFKAMPDGHVFSMGYNGYRETLYLYGLKNEPSELKVLVKCSCCESMWSFSFNDIEPKIESIWMKLRLLRQVSEYHYLHNEEPCKFVVRINAGKDIDVTLTPISKGRYLVKKGDTTIADAPWHIAMQEFIGLLPMVSDFDLNDIRTRNNDSYHIAKQADEIRRNINNV